MKDSTKLSITNASGAAAVAALLFFLYAVVGTVDYAAAGGCGTDSECEAQENLVRLHKGDCR